MSTGDVISQIEIAFAETPSPGTGFDDISATLQDEGIADYFRGTIWRGHPVRELRDHSCALAFFTDKAFRYWLPAFMPQNWKSQLKQMGLVKVSHSTSRLKKGNVFNSSRKLNVTQSPHSCLNV